MKIYILNYGLQTSGTNAFKLHDMTGHSGSKCSIYIPAESIFGTIVNLLNSITLGAYIMVMVRIGGKITEIVSCLDLFTKHRNNDI
jgi:hypothetical protein